MILVSLLLLTTVRGDEAKDATARFGSLKKLAESITAKSSKDEVISILGEPESRGIAGWKNPDTQVWKYLIFTDDSQHLRFEVSFSPKSGCSVAASHHQRKKIKKGKLRLMTGTVVTVYPYKSSGKKNGFLCSVLLADGSRETVTVGRSDRVTGELKKGALIRVEHFGINHHYIFEGYYSLLLKSIAFSKPKEADGE